RTMGHPNEERLRAGYDAFGRGDIEALRNEYFTEDAIWHSPGNNLLAGDYTGLDEIMGSFMKTFELTGGTFKLEIHDVLANDVHGVVLGRSTAQREGKKPLDHVHVVHFRDGKLSESWIHS